MSLIIPANSAAAASGYDVDYSCRFDNARSGDSASDYLTRTYTAGNRRTFTISFWIKRWGLKVSSWQQVLGQYDVGADQLFRVGYNSSEQGDVIRCYGAPGGFEFRTTALYRDVSAWYHVVLAIDTTQGTEANRAKLYVNGTQVTSFVTANYPSQNTELHYNEGKAHSIGRAGGGNQGLPAYLAQLISIDGTAYAASDFGEFSDDGIWTPIDVSGLTFGSQGFFLDFADAADLGDDESGNGNDWTETGIAAINQVTNTPTNNFATGNPLFYFGTGGTASATVDMSDGNLTYTSGSTAWRTAAATIAVSSGKWYMETKVISGTNYSRIGVSDLYEANAIGAGQFYLGYKALQIGYDNGGSRYTSDSGTSYGATYTAGDIIGVALDLDSGTKTVTFYKNNASQGAVNVPSSASSTNEWLFMQSQYGTVHSANYGNPVVALSSAAADANEYGAFEYAPPSGFFSICTKNLAEYG